MPHILDAVFRSLPQIHDDVSASVIESTARPTPSTTREALDLAVPVWREQNRTAHRALSMHALTSAPAAPSDLTRESGVQAAAGPVSQGAIDALFDEGVALIDAGQTAAGLHVLWSLVRLDEAAHNYRLMARTAAAASDVLEQLDASEPLGHVHIEPRRGVGLNLSIQRLTVLAQMVMAFGKLHQALIVPEIKAAFVERNGDEVYRGQVQYAHDMLLAAAQEAHMLCRETAQASMAIYAHSGVMRDITAGVFGADATQDPRVAAHFAALRWVHLNAFAGAVGAHLLTQETHVKALHDAIYTWQLDGQREIVGLVRALLPEALSEVEAFRAPTMAAANF